MNTNANCPDWCTNGDCSGEHHADVGMSYIPATGGLGRGSKYGHGIVFLSVGVALFHDTIDHLQPSISIHVSSEHDDAQADLHPHELRDLIRELVTALEVIEGRACLNDVHYLSPWPNDAVRQAVDAR